MKPGSTSPSPLSCRIAAGPAKSSISWRSPTATIVPSRTSIASANGSSVSAVKIVPVTSVSGIAPSVAKRHAPEPHHPVTGTATLERTNIVQRDGVGSVATDDRGHVPNSNFRQRGGVDHGVLGGDRQHRTTGAVQQHHRASSELKSVVDAEKEHSRTYHRIGWIAE